MFSISESSWKQLNILLQGLIQNNTQKEVERLISSVKKLLEVEDIKRIVSYLEQDLKTRQDEQLILKKDVNSEFERINNELIRDPNYKKISDDIDQIINGKKMNMEPEDKLIYMLMANQHAFQEDLLSLLNTYKQVIESLPTNYIHWKENEKNNEKIKSFLRNLRYIRHNIRAKNLKKITQSSLQLLIDIIKNLKSLSSISIESICFEYKGPKKNDRKDELYEKASLIVKINDTDPIKFKGVRAYNLYILLIAPFNSPDFSKFRFGKKTASKNDSKKDDFLVKEFNKQKHKIGEKWNKYGFICGVQSLIIHTGPYSHCINRKFAPLIKNINSA